MIGTRWWFRPQSETGSGSLGSFPRNGRLATVPFHRGAYDPAITLLLETRCDLWQIGGNHAERDVIDWTLSEAAVRAGQRDVSLSLAHERLGARPRSAPNRRLLRAAEAVVN